MSLVDMDTGQQGVIVALLGGAGLQRRLRVLGLVEGERFRKISRIGRAGPVIVVVNRVQIAVGFGMAAKIIVRKEQ